MTATYDWAFKQVAQVVKPGINAHNIVPFMVLEARRDFLRGRLPVLTVDHRYLKKDYYCHDERLVNTVTPVFLRIPDELAEAWDDS